MSDDDDESCMVFRLSGGGLTLPLISLFIFFFTL